MVSIVVENKDEEALRVAMMIHDVLNYEEELSRVTIISNRNNLKDAILAKNLITIILVHGDKSGITNYGISWSEIASLIENSETEYFILESCFSSEVSSYLSSGKYVHTVEYNIDTKLAFLDVLYVVKEILSRVNKAKYHSLCEHIREKAIEYFIENAEELFVRMLIPQTPLAVKLPEKSGYSGPIGFFLDMILLTSKQMLREMGRLLDDNTIDFGTEKSIELNFTRSLDLGGGEFPLNVTFDFKFKLQDTGDFEISTSLTVSKEQKGNLGRILNVIGTKIEGTGKFAAKGKIEDFPVSRLVLKSVEFEVSFQITKSLDIKEILRSIAPGKVADVIADVQKYVGLDISASIYFGGRVGIAYDFTTDVTKFTVSVWVGASLNIRITIVSFEAGVKVQFDVIFSPYGNTFNVTFTAFAKAAVDLYFATLNFEGKLEIKWSAGPEEPTGAQMNLDTDMDGLPDGFEETIGTDPDNADTDEDGIPDGIEIQEYKTDPLDNDTDDDGLIDGVERDFFEALGLDPRSDIDGDGMPCLFDEDSDNDFLLDGEEYLLGSNPGIRDSDGDGIIDGFELTNGTNPVKCDTDKDKIPDLEELYMNLDPTDNDTDDDKLLDGEEVYYYRTDPLNNDTDQDGLTDYAEIYLYNTDPLNNDTDGDGLSDGEEIGFATSPLNEDSDGDNLSDYLEINGWTIFFTNDSSGTIRQLKVTSDPTKKDTDGDKVSDGIEYINGSNPLTNDTDSDGITDYTEINGFYYDGVHFVKTDPARWDTDEDGLSDGAEKQAGTNPIDNDTDDDHLKDGFENSIGTLPTDPDSDDDGICDGDEYDYLSNVRGLDPNVTDSDGDGTKDILDSDSDNDGLLDGDELQTYFTDPLNADTDQDGASDKLEMFNLGTDPLNPDTDGDGLVDGTIGNPWITGKLGEGNVGTSPLTNDTDGDALLDGWEVTITNTPPFFSKITDPLDPDSDDDGLLDGHEYQLGTDPNWFDTDNDNIGDGYEVNGFNITYPDGTVIGPFYTDPLRNDTDCDGLSDGKEQLIYYTSPISPDTDGDGLRDKDEVDMYGTSPLNPDTDNDGLTDYEEIFHWNWDVIRKSDEELEAGAPGYPNETREQETLPPSEKATMPLSYFTYYVARFMWRITAFRCDYYTDPLDPDTDDDNLLDGQEKELATNPLNNDTDYDGLLDGDEYLIYHTDPRISDSDKDKLLDGEEVNIYSTDPLDMDTDDDELTDYEEIRYWGTNPCDNDTDKDNLLDGQEVKGILAWIYNRTLGRFVLTNVTTDPLDNDTDDDGLLDGIEVFICRTNPFSQDTDGDELGDWDEIFVYNTNATYFDTDYDGLLDGIEVNITKTNPLIRDEDGDGLPDGKMFDNDNDTLCDYDEIYLYGTNVMYPDTDGDGMLDGWESLYNSTNPRIQDAACDPDQDELTNIEELVYGTNPDNNDTDGDGLTDGYEVKIIGTSPLDQDTDRDHMSDHEELERGTDPLVKDTDPPDIFVVSITPEEPKGNESLTIHVKVIDPAPILNVVLGFYDGVDWMNITMRGINETDYIAELDGLPLAQTVKIVIYAQDKALNWNYTDEIDIYVRDIYGPTIQLVSLTPISPFEGENVTVTVIVDDLVDIVDVILSYYDGESWYNITMDRENGNQYSAIITDLRGRTYCKIMVYARDSDGNWNVENLGGFYVQEKEEKPVMDMLSLLIGISIGIIGAMVIFITVIERKRRRK